MFASFLLLFGSIFTVLMLMLLVPDIPISFNDIFVFCVYTIILVLFPLSLLAMLIPGTMSGVYNKMISTVGSTGIFRDPESRKIVHENAPYRSFNIVTVTIGFMSIFGFIIVLLMYIYGVNIDHKYYKKKKPKPDQGKGRMCESGQS